ncbi:hypothetical protein BH10BAC2_BH10BAC2_24420 [soil metagenome]
MKQTLLFSLLFFCIFLNQTSAQSNFQKQIKTGKKAFNNRLTKTTDGGYIHLGEADDFAGNDSVTHKLVITKLDGDANITWMKSFLDTTKRNILIESYYESSLNVVQAEDGGYIISTQVPLLVFKLDAAGELAWSEKIGLLSASYSLYTKTDMEPSAGGVIITGTIIQPTSPQTSSFILNIDGSNGNVQWFKSLNFKNEISGYAYSIYSNAVEAMKDGSYVICGTVTHKKNDDNAFIAHFNKDGKLNGTRNFSYPNRFTAIKETLNGSFLTAGSIKRSRVYADYDVCVMSFDASVNVNWAKQITITDNSLPKNNEQVTTILANPDNSFIMAGQKRPLSDGYVFKLTSAGNAEWAKLISHTDKLGIKLNDLATTADNGFIAAGDYSEGKAFFAGKEGYFSLYKFNSDGNTCIQTSPLQTVTDFQYIDFADRIMMAEDLTGLVQVSASSVTKLPVHYSVKDICKSLKALSVVYSEKSSISKKQADACSVKVFPNPVSGRVLNISINYPKINAVQLTVLNTDGNVMMSRNVLLNPGVTNIALPVNLAAGIFILKVTVGNQQQTVKFVKVD